MIKKIAILVVLLPLCSCILSGFMGNLLGKRVTHRFAVSLLGLASLLSAYMVWGLFSGKLSALNSALYLWGETSHSHFQIGFLIDNLSAVMMMTVTFVSWMVHIYSIGYMAEDPGYCRFFAYISAFTFAMLILVMSNNFLQLFFGWEAVGVISYLLIGFWYEKESAIFANLKAFLVNRLGDVGFILGIAAIFKYCGSLDYSEVFAISNTLVELEPWHFLGVNWPVIDVATGLLFVGAMAKSAQIPLHVWLPDSMEGPTPISALIHAATMVTAGIFMVCRCANLFELAHHTLKLMMWIGAVTAFAMGLLALVQHDIKRIIAYSTISQLGYMVTALGLSAYSLAIFHLVTHAFFKALLFLSAGAVIIALHHEQDINKMGGLKKQLPIIYWVMLLASLALIGFPGFSGFYSKELIIETAKHTNRGIYILLLMGVYVTSLYSLRLIVQVFHGRKTKSAEKLTKEVQVPLIVLVIPSVLLGGIMMPAVLNNMLPLPGSFAIEKVGALAMFVHGFVTMPFALICAAAATVWYLYIYNPKAIIKLTKLLRAPIWILQHKYGFDWFNENILVKYLKCFATALWNFADKGLIDGMCVHGVAKLAGLLSKQSPWIQTGFLHHYMLWILLSLIGFLFWFVWI